MKFAEIFKSLRKDKELTQEQLAEVLGVSPQIVSRWENGVSQPSLELLPTIASYFETSVDQLVLPTTYFSHCPSSSAQSTCPKKNVPQLRSLEFVKL